MKSISLNKFDFNDISTWPSLGEDVLLFELNGEALIFIGHGIFSIEGAGWDAEYECCPRVELVFRTQEDEYVCEEWLKSNNYFWIYMKKGDK